MKRGGAHRLLAYLLVGIYLIQGILQGFPVNVSAEEEYQELTDITGSAYYGVFVWVNEWNNYFDFGDKKTLSEASLNEPLSSKDTYKGNDLFMVHFDSAQKIQKIILTASEEGQYPADQGFKIQYRKADQPNPENPSVDHFGGNGDLAYTSTASGSSLEITLNEEIDANALLIQATGNGSVKWSISQARFYAKKGGEMPPEPTPTPTPPVVDHTLSGKAYYGVMAAGWTGLNYTEANIDEGVFSKTLSSASSYHSGDLFMAVFDTGRVVEKIILTSEEEGQYPDSFKLQYRRADQPNPGIDQGGWGGIVNFSDNEIQNFTKNASGKTMEISLPAPIEANAVLIQATGDGTVKWTIQSAEFTGKIIGKVPAKPTELSAQNLSSTSVTLNWTDEGGLAESFDVYRAESMNGEYQKIASTSTASYTDDTLTARHTYYYKVQGVNENGTSEFSSVLTVKAVQTGNLPAPVPSLSEAAGVITLSWPEVNQADSYQIYRAEGKYGSYQPLDEVSETTFRDTVTGEKYKYYYKVSALDSEGKESELSEEVALEKNLFGDTMTIFSPDDSVDEINRITAETRDKMKDMSQVEFSDERYAFLFKPGSYQVDKISLGYYTTLYGLGQTPYDTVLPSIEVPVWGANALTNFWRSVENLAIDNNSPDTTVKWAVSQAAPMRRLYINGNLALDDGSEASGGYLSDSLITGQAGSWTQQQFFIRNSSMKKSWYGGGWNTVLVGTENAPASSQDWANTGWMAYTNVQETPAVREKPFLYVGDDGDYKVFVPGLRKNVSGVSWDRGDAGPGVSISIDDFYVAKADTDTTDTINTALSQGKHLLLTPGVYHLNQSIQVKRAGTVVLGIGMATIVPTDGNDGIQIADVDGVTLAGVLIDAGTKESEHLIQVGPEGASADHSANPTLLSDVYTRVGGAVDGKAKITVEINSNNVIGDHFWLWRADHGKAEDSTGWDKNTAKNGLVVNGDDVTVYGLFCEHFQEYQTLWNGNGGRMYFYQSELPYDPPYQKDWMSQDGTVNGYSSYKVSDDVQSHEAYGLGVYEVFIHTKEFMTLDSGIGVSDNTKVINACIVSLGHNGRISHVINQQGGYVDATKEMTGVKVALNTYDPDAGPTLDKEKLQILFNENHARVAENYTSDSYQSFAEKLKKAETLLNTGKTTQKEIDKAAKELEDAVSKLVLSKSALDGDNLAQKKGVCSWYYASSDSGQRDVKVLSKTGGSWFYNWSIVKEAAEEAEDMEYVPMIWNGYGVNDETLAALREGKEKGLYKNLLTFNEPDLAGQAEMTVEEALECWPRLMETGLRLGSPAPASVDSSWLAEFMQGAEKKGYCVDFINLHVYQDFTHPDSVEGLKKALTDLYKKYHKPIWITELGAIDVTPLWGGYQTYAKPSVELARNYIQEVTQMLESLDFVERYAWFVDSSSDVEGTQYTRLFDTSNDSLTEVGETYAAVKGSTRPKWITVDHTELKAVVGDEYELFCWVNPILPSSKIRWTSSNDSIASVENGKVTAKTAGIARISASTVDGNFRADCTVEVREPLDTSGWEAKASSNRQGEGNVEANVFDKNLDTVWMTTNGRVSGDWFQVDMKNEYTLSGILINAGGFTGNMLTDYTLEISENGMDWTPVHTGKLTNAKEAVWLEKPLTTRYFRLVAKSAHDSGWSWVIAELSAFGAEELVNPLKLQDLYEEYKTLQKDRYTEKSWGPFETALKQTEAILKKPSDYDKQQIDQMYQTLEQSRKDLIFKQYQDQYKAKDGTILLTIDAKGLIPEMSTLIIEKIGDRQLLDKLQNAWKSLNQKNIAFKQASLYDIYCLQENNRIPIKGEKSQDGEIVLTFHIPDNYKAENCGIYYLNDDGTKLTDMQAGIDPVNRTATVKTSHLSYYALIETTALQAPDDPDKNDNPQEIPSPTPDQNGTPPDTTQTPSQTDNKTGGTSTTKNNTVQSASTGDEAPIGLYTTLLLLTAVILTAYGLHRKKTDSLDK